MLIRAARKLGTASVALAVAMIAATALATMPAASDSHRTSEPHAVVATGLDNPRHIAVNQLGKIFVAEAGRGGDALVDTPLGDSDGPVCVGTTGAITQLTTSGPSRIITGLPSVASAIDGVCGGPGFGFGATGPHGLDVDRTAFNYSIGLGGTPAPRQLLTDASAAAASMGTVNNTQWKQNPSIDLAAFEAAADPDTQGADSNPYGVLRTSAATTVATDAGGNTLVEVDLKGSTDVLAVFAPRCVPWGLPFPNPVPPVANPCGDQALFPSQPVPTGVAETGNGDYLVTTLGGFPFVQGQSLVYRVSGSHSGTAVCSTVAFVPANGCSVFADGLTALVDIDIAPDGKVYVVQFDDNGILADGDAGSVQILHRRTGEVMGSIVGLTLPGGIAIDHRKVYISDMSIFAGAGQVVEGRTLCTQLRRAQCQNG